MGGRDGPAHLRFSAKNPGEGVIFVIFRDPSRGGRTMDSAGISSKPATERSTIMATQLRQQDRCSEAEWATRQDLAACYRIFDMLGWSESIYNHITVRVPGEEAFLINP